MRENVGCSFHSSQASWDLRLEEGLGFPRGLRVLRERSEKPCPVGALVCVDSLNVEDFSLNCQAQVPSPKVKTKRTWADTKITWATNTHNF